MKKILLALCLAFTLVACHSDDETEPAVIYDETFFIYMPWTGNLTDYLQSNINAIKRSIVKRKGLGTKRVLVFFAKNTTQSALYEIKYTNGECKDDTLKHYTFKDTDYTTVEGLSSILRDVKNSTKTGKYSMLIGCHGSGWLPVGRPMEAPRRAFGATNTYAKYQAEISTLAKAVTDAAMPMEFILFDDCYMAGIEIAYELRNATHYFIASTCEIMDVGMPYELCFPPLLAHDYNAVLDAFYEFYNSYSRPYGTLSVIDCRETGAAADIMKRINAAYTIDVERLEMIQKLDGCNQTIFYDMGSYVENLVNDNEEPLLLEFRKKLIDLVPYYICTKEYISYLHSRAGIVYPINSFSGITNSDATENQYVAEDKLKTSWWLATH